MAQIRVRSRIMKISHKPATTIKVLVLDLNCISRLLNSAAFAAEQQAAIKTVWKEYSDSKLINALYYFHDAKPGYAEISFGDRQLIQKRTNQRYEKMCNTFVKKCAEGPRAVGAYMARVERIRDGALASIKTAMRDVQKINAQVLTKAEQTIAVLKMVKAGSTIFLAGAVLVFTGGAAAGAGWATTATTGFFGPATVGIVGGIYFGYELATPTIELSVAFVDSWSRAHDAHAIAIVKELGEEAGEKVGEKLDKAGQADLSKSSGHRKRGGVARKKNCEAAGKRSRTSTPRSRQGKANYLNPNRRILAAVKAAIGAKSKAIRRISRLRNRRQRARKQKGLSDVAQA